MGNSSPLVLQTLVYGFVLWFALYLLQRASERKLFYTGLGLGAYALALAFDLLAQFPQTTSFFLRLHWGILPLPAIFWTGATLHLLPDHHPRKSQATQLWQRGLLPAGIFLTFLYLFAPTLWNPTGQAPALPGYLLLLAAGLLPLISGLWVIQTVFSEWPQSKKEKRKSIGLILTAALFFSLGSGLFLLQIPWLPHSWVVLALSLDLEILGLTIAYLDAFEQGERLWPDFLRSLSASALAALLFGGQIAVVIALSTGITLPMVILLLSILSLAIGVQVYAEPIQIALDRILFAQYPHLRQERADLRGVASALPRTAPVPLPLSLDEEDFIQFTRRALSHFGDLPKIATNPLTHLPLIETRLNARGAPLNTLERAAELKTLLAESVERLKPVSGETYGISDAWRFYNAVYYPYILGLRPYSRRAASPSDGEIQAILTWFRTAVPERTLHNWQNAAAALIAQDLREQSPHATS